MSDERSNESKRTILLVDDYEPQLNTWERDFRRDFKTLRATCRDDALREARTGHPDAALLDLFLGGGENGLDVTRDLKALYPNLFVVVVSVNMTVDLTMDAVRAGADHVAVKPIGCTQLMKLIEDGVPLGGGGDELNANRNRAKIRSNRGEPRTMGWATDERSIESGLSAVLYKCLLGLHTHEDPELMLDDAVRLIVELTGAQLCIVELFDDAQQPKFWRGHGCTDAELDVLRTSISRGIVAHALEIGQTVQVTSALADVRFAENDSVKQREIEAVLCTPLVSAEALEGSNRACGFVYIQGRVDAGPFTDDDRKLVELTAAHVAQVASNLIERRHLLDALVRHDWNVTAAARELQIARSHLYALMDKFKLRRG